MSLEAMIDKAKAKTGSDYRTAERLGISRSAISHMRKTNQISNETARQLAEIVGCSPLEVIAAAEIAKHPDRAKLWKKWAGTAAILTAGIIVFSSFNSKTYAAFNDATNYTLCAVAIRLLAQWMLYAWTLTTCAARRV